MTNPVFGKLSIISMRGCEDFGNQVDRYLREWRGCEPDENFFLPYECPRFTTGEAKGMIQESLRGHDLYIICDVFNYGVKYKMYGEEKSMSPDDHYADLKRIIAAASGKPRRVSVIMPMLYEGRQHKRIGRESLDCALMLQELENMGVTNIVTFDAHDPRVQNAVPICGFDDVRPTYQMIKALVRNVDDIIVDKEHVVIISPDEGAMGRCVYYSSILGLDIGMFYKRRDYTRIVEGRNPIEAQEYLGGDLYGKDVIIVDDIISSGDSLIHVADQLKRKGAKRIYAFVTFGLFTDGLEKFDKAYADGLFTKIFTTNLVYRTPDLLSKPWYAEVNMCKYMAYIIDTLNHDYSISKILNPANKIHALIERHKEEMQRKAAEQNG